MLLATEKCSTEGTDYRVAARAGDTLYVGTSTALVDKFRVNGDKLEKTGKFELTGSEYCNRLRYDASGSGLFYCCENGLGFIDCASDSVTELTASDGDGIYIIKNDKVAGHIGVEEGLETAVILRIVSCTGGYLYVTSNGLFFDDGSGRVRRLRNFPYSNNYDILISESRNCYITFSAGLFIVPEEKLLADGEYFCTLLNESCRNAKVNTDPAVIVRFSLNGGEKVSDAAADSFEDTLITGLKKNDVVSRYAGSFFVLLYNVSAEEAEKAASRLAESWEFQPGDLVDKTAACLIACFVPEGGSHPDSFIAVPHNSSYFTGRNIEEVLSEFRQLGFSSVISVPKKEKKKKLKQKTEYDAVLSVMINGVTKFKKNIRFEQSADVIVSFSEAKQG